MGDLKQQVARAALEYVHEVSVLGLGSGTTVQAFIELLPTLRGQLEGCVVASEETARLVKACGIPVLSLNAVSQLSLYLDGADEITHLGEAIKGGGASLTREKILATAAKEWICLVDESKVVKRLGVKRPVPVEVLPMARSFVARELVKLGGDPVYREGVVTDNQNDILDVYRFELHEPIALEHAINRIPGVIENGLFAERSADRILVAGASGVVMVDVR